VAFEGDDVPIASRTPDEFAEPDSTSGAGASADLDLMFALGARLRDLVPPDLRQRLNDALRELLLAVRALIDWYLERAERRKAAPIEVTDIPIS
jgi:hypothetical protein